MHVLDLFPIIPHSVVLFKAVLWVQSRFPRTRLTIVNRFFSLSWNFSVTAHCAVFGLFSRKGRDKVKLSVEAFLMVVVTTLEAFPAHTCLFPSLCYLVYRLKKTSGNIQVHCQADYQHSGYLNLEL